MGNVVGDGWGCCGRVVVGEIVVEGNERSSDIYAVGQQDFDLLLY